MATGETFRATVIGQLTFGGAVVYDYGYVDLASGSTHLDMGIAAGNFQTLVQAKLAAASTSALSFVRYRFACVSGTHIGEIGYVEVASPVSGASASNINPLEIAISMKRSTGHSSRRDRGRVFWGPVPTEFNLGDNPDLPDTSNAALQDIMNLGKADLVTGGVTLKPVILSADGSYSGRVIVQVSMGKVYVHHKSRRTGIGG